MISARNPPPPPHTHQVPCALLAPPPPPPITSVSIISICPSLNIVFGPIVQKRAQLLSPFLWLNVFCTTIALCPVTGLFSDSRKQGNLYLNDFVCVCIYMVQAPNLLVVKLSLIRSLQRKYFLSKEDKGK